MPIDENSIPVIEQIARLVKTRLESVTANNGYIYSVVEVVRPKRRNDYSPKDGVVVMQMESFDQFRPETDDQGLLISRAVTFAIDAFIEPSDEDETAYDHLCAIAMSEIERAFTVDFYPTGGIGPFAGKANDASMNAPQIIRDKNGRSAGVRMSLTVRYRYADTDPYNPL